MISSFLGFLGEIAPWLAILLGRMEMGVMLHVSRTMVVMLSVSVFSELQASCHCSSVR